MYGRRKQPCPDVSLRQRRNQTWKQTSPLGVPSSGLLKTGGYIVLVFAALGVYLFFGASDAGTGGKGLPLGKPLLHG